MKLRFLVVLCAFIGSIASAQSVSQEGAELLAQIEAVVENIDTDQLQQQMKANPETILVDVRTADEIKQLGTIGLYQNINIPRGWLEFRIADSARSKDTPIVVYCGTNVRSPMAAKTLINTQKRSFAHNFLLFASLFFLLLIIIFS